MLNALLVFLIGALILGVIVYVFNLILGMMALPGEIKQISLTIVGLVSLIFLILLAVHAFQAAGGHPIVIVG